MFGLEGVVVVVVFGSVRFVSLFVVVVVVADVLL